MGIILNFDDAILLFIKNNMHGYIMDKFMIIITSLGNGGIFWIAIACLLAISKKYRRIGFMVMAALLLSTILGEGILKHLVQRSRPSADNLLIAKPLTFSFPSGHAACSFAAAGVLAKYLKKYAVVVWILASLIAFSRLYLYVHYPSDVIGGIVLGLICSYSVIYVFNKYSNKHENNTL